MLMLLSLIIVDRPHLVFLEVSQLKFVSYFETYYFSQYSYLLLNILYALLTNKKIPKLDLCST